MAKTKPTKLFHAPPWKNGDRKEWLTVGKIAALYARHPNTVLKWLHNGTLDSFGFSTFRDFQGRWFIRPPAEKKEHSVAK